MSVEDPVVITCAISGVLANREQCPAIPYTPVEYAAEARRIVDEGGTMVHIHARTSEGGPSFEVADYKAISDVIRAEVGDAAIINFSTGGLGVARREAGGVLAPVTPRGGGAEHGLDELRQVLRARKDFVFNMVFPNPFEDIVELPGAMHELGMKPEHECFDPGHVANPEPLIDMGVLKPPLHVDCIMGVVGGIPPGARNLAAMVANIPGLDAPTNTSGVGAPGGGGGCEVALGGDRRSAAASGKLVAAALTLGGSIRVGLEDNLYLPGGEMARSNGELIAKARQMTEDVGRRPATVQEARELLNIPAARWLVAGWSWMGWACRPVLPRVERFGVWWPPIPRDGRAAVSLPLEGIRVLEISRLLPGASARCCWRTSARRC